MTHLVQLDHSWFPELLPKYVNKFIPCTVTETNQSTKTIQIVDSPLAREVCTVGWTGDVDNFHIFPYRFQTFHTTRSVHRFTVTRVVRRQVFSDEAEPKALLKTPFQLNFYDEAGSYCHRIYQMIRAAMKPNFTLKDVVPLYRHDRPDVFGEEHDCCYLRQFANFELRPNRPESITFTVADPALKKRLERAVRMFRDEYQRELDAYSGYAEMKMKKSCEDTESACSDATTYTGSSCSSKRGPKLLKRSEIKKACFAPKTEYIPNRPVAPMAPKAGWVGTTQLAATSDELSRALDQVTIRAPAMKRVERVIKSKPHQWGPKPTAVFPTKLSFQKAPTALDFPSLPTVAPKVVIEAPKPTRVVFQKPVVQKAPAKVAQIQPAKPVVVEEKPTQARVEPTVVTKPVAKVEKPVVAVRKPPMRQKVLGVANPVLPLASPVLPELPKAASTEYELKAVEEMDSSSEEEPAMDILEPSSLERHESAFTDKGHSDDEETERTESPAPIKPSSKPKVSGEKLFWSLAEMTTEDITKFMSAQKSAMIRKFANAVQEMDITGDDLQESDEDALEMLQSCGMQKAWSKKLLKSLKNNLAQVAQQSSPTAAY